MRYQYHCVYLLLACLSLTACQADSRQQALASSQSQVAVRQYQTRAFETPDQPLVQRAVISTLQDLGFVVDQADSVVGAISGTKLDGYALRMTVTIRPRNEKQTVVRSNATFNVRTVDDPLPYQQFFSALSKSLFLAEQNVD